jgi:hypothetical protein
MKKSVHVFRNYTPFFTGKAVWYLQNISQFAMTAEVAGKV